MSYNHQSDPYSAEAQKTIPLADGCYLSRPSLADVPDYVLHLNNPNIVCHLASVPQPYTEESGRAWINFIEVHEEAKGWLSDFAIRLPGGQLIGGIGFHVDSAVKGNCAEIGYWLAEAYWRRGIVTRAIQAIVQYAKSTVDFPVLMARVFEDNPGSMKVLEKCGFEVRDVLPPYSERNSFDRAFLVYIKN